jgi:hypothetical protein
VENRNCESIKERWLRYVQGKNPGYFHVFKMLNHGTYSNSFCFPKQEEKEENVLRAADRQMKLLRILKDGIVLKVLNVNEELSSRSVSESHVKNELSVMLMANLQEKQHTESRAVENILAEKV